MATASFGSAAELQLMLGLDHFVDQPGSGSEAHPALLRAVDRVNQRFGRGTIYLAGQGIKPRWQMRREMLSPRFTTCWEELPRVKA